MSNQKIKREPLYIHSCCHRSGNPSGHDLSFFLSAFYLEVCTPGWMHRGAFMLPELRQSRCLSSRSWGPREAHGSPRFQQGLFYTWDLKTAEESVFKGTDKSVMRSCHLVSDDICHLKALDCTLLFLCGLHFFFALVFLPRSPPPLTLSISVHYWSSRRDVCTDWTLYLCVRTCRLICAMEGLTLAIVLKGWWGRRRAHFKRIQFKFLPIHSHRSWVSQNEKWMLKKLLKKSLCNENIPDWNVPLEYSL